MVPTPRLRQMEIEANAVFDLYRKQYFETGISSVYFFNTDEKDDKGFGACFLIHKGACLRVSFRACSRARACVCVC